jgi:hypothetical protein
MKHCLTIVTEENKLSEKAKNLVKAVSLDELTTPHRRLITICH